jgi:hypothetical protein
MKRKYEVKILDDKPIYIDQLGIQVYSNGNSIYVEHGKFRTDDIAEAVAYLMYLPKFNNDSIWNFNITKYKSSISPCRSLYWLSGGDNEWVDGYTYDISWSSVYDLYDKEFSDIIYDIVANATTLNDIKNNFIYKLNIPIFWEFALKNKIINYERIF